MKGIRLFFLMGGITLFTALTLSSCGVQQPAYGSYSPGSTSSALDADRDGDHNGNPDYDGDGI